MGDLLGFLATHLHVTALLIVVAYALAIACAIREVMNSRTSQGSIAWVMALLILPVPFIFFYAIFGWKLFDGYAVHQGNTDRLLRSEAARKLLQVDEDESERWQVLTKVSHLPFLRGNEVELLIDGKATFGSIFAGIAAAKTYLFVQFYTIRNDALGRELADHLIAKAREGVSIYFLYDDVGSTGLGRRYKQRLKDAGIKVSAFNERHRWLRLYGPTRIQYRNHRKIVVADGKVAWFGGLNVAVDYLGLNKRFGPWRDTHLRIAGPAALAAALVFREDWHWATGQHLSSTLPDVIETPGDQSVLVMPSGPADDVEEVSISFLEIISKARERVWIVSPYFVPDLDMQIALYTAALRGVDVRIMLPAKPDHFLVWQASNSHADAMVRHGVGVYRYHRGFVHQKVILMDSLMAGVGSVNFDNRSFNINFEIMAWFPDTQMIEDVEAMLVRDFANCRQVTLDEVNARPVLSRFVSQAARLFSPIL